MSQHNPYNANMIPGGYNGAANANPAAASANHYGAANHHPQVAHNPVAEMHAAAAAGTITKVVQISLFILFFTAVAFWLHAEILTYKIVP